MTRIKEEEEEEEKKEREKTPRQKVDLFDL